MILAIGAGLAAADPLPRPPAPLPVFDAQPALADLDTAFYPLGWSEDGKRLAYLAIHPWEAGDAPTISMVIVDLQTDKTIHKQSWENLAETGIDFADQKAGFARFWTGHGAAILATLKTHQMVGAEMQLHSFPGFFGERRRGVLNAIVTQKTAGHPLGEVGSTSRGVSDYSIDLVQDGTAKNVFRTAPPKDGEVSVYPLAINVRGFLLNNAEDRIAILVAITEVGWEGPPHPRTLNVVGATIGKKF